MINERIKDAYRAAEDRAVGLKGQDTSSTP
jgi:hypothetical protein